MFGSDFHDFFKIQSFCSMDKFEKFLELSQSEQQTKGHQVEKMQCRFPIQSCPLNEFMFFREKHIDKKIACRSMKMTMATPKKKRTTLMYIGTVACHT